MLKIHPKEMANFKKIISKNVHQDQQPNQNDVEIQLICQTNKNSNKNPFRKNFYFNVSVPQGWILSLFISRYIFPYLNKTYQIESSNTLFFS